MAITLTDTYRHLDGTPGAGYVLVRTVTPFHDGQGTVLGDWVSYPLASDGSVSIVINADLEHADPGPQWLQIMEQITCQRGGVWEIGPDVLFASPDPTIELGAVRQLPAITADAPRYVPVPGAQGPAGPTGPTGPATQVTVDGVDPLPQGDQPTVTDTDPGPDVALRFGIPTGGVTFADFMGMTPVDYDPTASYAPDDIVRWNGALWVVKRAVGPGEDPSVKPGSWQNMMLDDVANKARNAQHGLDDKVDRAGDTMTGGLKISSTSARMTVAGTGSVGYEIEWPAGVRRMLLFTNDGDNLFLRQYDDQGIQVAQPLRLQGSIGMVDMTGARQVQVPVPTGDRHVPRLARDPDPTTGDLGLPGGMGNDTGWREITAWDDQGNVTGEALSPGLWAPGDGREGYVHLRRVGNTVYVHLFRIQKLGDGRDALWDTFRLPSGFVSSAWDGPPASLLGTGQLWSLAAAGAGNVLGITGDAATGPGGTAILQRFEDYTWPDSLPGKEVSPPAQWK